MDTFTAFFVPATLFGFLAVTWAIASGHLSIEDKVQEAGREYYTREKPLHSLSDLYTTTAPALPSKPPRCLYCGRPGKDKNQCPGCGAP